MTRAQISINRLRWLIGLSLPICSLITGAIGAWKSMPSPVTGFAGDPAVNFFEYALPLPFSAGGSHLLFAWPAAFFFPILITFQPRRRMLLLMFGLFTLFGGPALALSDGFGVGLFYITDFSVAWLVLLLSGILWNDQVPGYEYFVEGRACLDRGQLEKASDLLLRSLREAAHFKTCELLGTCFEKQGDLDGALKYFKKAYELNSKSDKTATLYAEMLLRFDEVDRARSLIDEVLERNRTYGPANALREILNER